MSRSAKRSAAIFAVVRGTSRLSMRFCSPPNGCVDPIRRRAMPAPNEPARDFRYISHKRRTKEDRRFITGAGHFVADISLPGMLHVALVASPHPFARIVSIDVQSAVALEG